MDDKLDNDLKKRIKEVFDNYEDTSADEGWLKLREKFPEKAKRRPVIWLWASSIAAMLLLFLGIMFFRTKTVVEKPLVANKTNPGNNLTQKVAESKKDSDTSKPKIDQLANNTAQTKTVTGNSVQKTTRKQATENQSNDAINKGVVIANHNGTNELAASNHRKPLSPGINTIRPDNMKPDTTGRQNNQALIANNVPSTNTAPKTVTAPTAGAKPGTETQQAADNKSKPVYASNESYKKKDKNNDFDHSVRFGAYATSFFNYAKGSSSQLNAGAGISTDIPLSKKFRLSTGVAITHNSLNYAVPGTSGNNNPNTPASLSSANYLEASAFSVQGNFTVPNYIIKSNSAASMLGLDIPVNLTYMFNPQKNDTYISAGFSSGTFANEKYSFDYSYPSSFASKVVGLPNQSNPKSFNSFYLAKTLNFAFGKAVRIGGNKIIVEPFVKYPLQGLGTQQIRFGSSGVNLKFNILGR